MPKFRKKPVVIDAEPVSNLITDAAAHWSNLPGWIVEAYQAGDVLFLRDAIEVRTLEGTMRAERSDMLIRGVKGEIYPCKPDIFAATYDPADPIPEPGAAPLK